MTGHHHPTNVRRRGTIAILSLVLMVMMLVGVVMSVDLGYLHVAKSQAQRAADAGALAGAWRLTDTPTDLFPNSTAARLVAEDFGARNLVLRETPQFASDDVVVGYISDPSQPAFGADGQLVFDDTSGAYPANAVSVRVRRTADSAGGDIPLFFSRILGIDKAGVEATATAAVLTNVGGFVTPSDNSNLGILPFALDLQTWNQLVQGQVSEDKFRWHEGLQKVVSGSDGVHEVNLFPQGTGSPGNRGTVDIGASNNSNADIVRQIRHGISPGDMADLAAEGRTLVLNGDGYTMLNGDTGISAGAKGALTEAIGRPSVIPLFESVTGPGNNAEYKIVGFAGVRIVEVELSGKMSQKRVMVQPARVHTVGAQPSTSGTQTSWNVYSPGAWLIK